MYSVRHLPKYWTSFTSPQSSICHDWKELLTRRETLTWAVKLEIPAMWRRRRSLPRSWPWITLQQLKNFSVKGDEDIWNSQRRIPIAKVSLEENFCAPRNDYYWRITRRSWNIGGDESITRRYLQSHYHIQAIELTQAFFGRDYWVTYQKEKINSYMSHSLSAWTWGASFNSSFYLPLWWSEHH